MAKYRMVILLGAAVYALGVPVSTGSVAWAQPPPVCESERDSLRWLVQRYGSERTQLEFALAASEARRQAAEARLKALEDALKSAPKGQK